MQRLNSLLPGLLGSKASPLMSAGLPGVVRLLQVFLRLLEPIP